MGRRNFTDLPVFSGFWPNSERKSRIWSAISLLSVNAPGGAAPAWIYMSPWGTQGDLTVKVRRVIGAGIMFAGAAMIVATIAWIAIVVAGEMRARATLFEFLAAAWTAGAWPMLAGLAVMILGRVVYGHWRTAAPVVNVTGEIARTVGLVSAILLGGMLIFLLATGFSHEDTPAAAALAIGVVFGVWVAQFGGNLRGRGYLD